MNKDKLNNLPVFKKAEEISNLIYKFTELIFDDSFEDIDMENDVVTDIAMTIRNDSQIIPTKIVGAEAVKLYGIKMANAAIIRQAAIEISTSTYSLELFGFTENDYLEIIRNEIDEFRVLFAEWVKTFDSDIYMIDNWGLFNPIGVEYDDYEDDASFESGMFFGDDFFEDDSFRIDRFDDDDDFPLDFDDDMPF